MNKLTIVVFFLISSLFSVSLKSQIVIKLGDVANAIPGTQVAIPVYISGFSEASGKGMSAIDLRFICSQSVASFSGIQNGSVYTPTNQWIAGSIGTSLRANWIENNLSFVSFPDNTVVLEFVVDYLGGNTSLVFESGCEVLDETFNVVADAQFMSGSITQSISGGITQWNGTGNWSQNENWSNGVPSDSTDAVIASGAVSVAGNSLCRNLSINSAASLIILPGSAITVNGNLDVVGNIEIKMDSILPGSLIVRKNLTQSGVALLSRNYFHNQEYLTSFPFNSINQTDLLSLGTVSKWSESSNIWNQVSSFNPALGLGFSFRSTQTGISSTSGVINVASVTIPLTNSSTGNVDYGWNLIGNPFPSAFNTQSGLNFESINRAVYAWNNGRFLVWNGSVGSLPNGIIPFGTAFFVKTNTASTSVILNKEGVLHDFDWFNGDVQNVDNLLIVKFSDFSDATISDRLYIQTEEGSSFGFEGTKDALKLANSEQYPDFFSIHDDISFSIDVTPYPSVIPLGVKIPYNGSWSFSIEKNTFDATRPVYLYDKEADILRDLREGDYFFQANTSNITDRFELQLTGVGINDPSIKDFSVWFDGECISVKSTEGTNSPVQIEVYNLLGSRVSNYNGKIGESTIRLKSISGINLVRITNSESQTTYKVFAK